MFSIIMLTAAYRTRHRKQWAGISIGAVDMPEFDFDRRFFGTLVGHMRMVVEMLINGT
ncbi:MAG: hypothetical protein ABI373_05025 [Flavobacteriales bacterium]